MPDQIPKIIPLVPATQSELFFEKLHELPEDKRAFFENIYSLLTDIEMDRDFNNAIIDGSWPDADRIILRRRQKLAERLAERRKTNPEAP